MALIEFALCAPVFTLMLLGTIDFGRVMIDQAKLTAVVRAGAEYGAVNPAASASDVVRAAMSGAGNLSATTSVTATNYCGCSSSTSTSCATTCSDGSSAATYLRVTATDQMSLTFPYPMMPNPLPLTRSLTIRVP